VTQRRAIATRTIAMALIAPSIMGSLLAAACSSDPPPPPPLTQGPLAEGTVARVGRHAITVPLIARVSRAQRVPPTEARERAVRDALLASGAEDAKLDRDLDVQLGARAVLARRLLQDLAAEAEQGAITDRELAAATEQHWLEVDRPEAFRVVHAVVRLDRSAPDAKREAARAVAEALRAALLPLRDRLSELTPPTAPDNGPAPSDPLADAFVKRASEMPHEGFELVPQPLDPVTADGRTLTPKPGTFDVDFARAAASLHERGELSPIVQSAFGLHVLMLLERIPEQRLSEPERRAKLRDEIIATRARAAVDRVLVPARARVTRANDADALLTQIAIAP
jgi:hypothetical protein